MAPDTAKMRNTAVRKRAASQNRGTAWLRVKSSTEPTVKGFLFHSLLFSFSSLSYSLIGEKIIIRSGFGGFFPASLHPWVLFYIFHTDLILTSLLFLLICEYEQSKTQ